MRITLSIESRLYSRAQVRSRSIGFTSFAAYLAHLTQPLIAGQQVIDPHMALPTGRKRVLSPRLLDVVTDAIVDAAERHTLDPSEYVSLMLLRGLQ